MKLSLFSKDFSDGLKTAGAEAEGFSAKTAKIGEGLQKMAKAGVAVGLGIAAVSVKMAGDWQASMIKLMTSAGETGSVIDGKLTGPIAQVSDGLLKMAVQTGTSTKELASGMYFVESAGFHGADGLKVMRAAAEGAKAEGADLSTVTDALTTALHDMGEGASYSVPMMNMMVRAVGDGKMTMEAFAGSLHSVLPQAHQAGISFSDVAGAVATMTVAGTSADQATQMLGHTISSLQNPNAQAVKWMGQMGLSASDLKENLGSRGLLGTITMVDQAILQHMGKDGTVLQSAFTQSQSAAQDLQAMLAKMPPTLRQWSQEAENGSMSAKDYSSAIKTLPEQLYAQGSQFMTVYKNANSFNQALKSGTPDVDTFAGMLRKVLGDSVDANTALQIGGQNLAYYAQTASDVAAAGQNAGDHIETWSTIQQGFNFRIDQAKEALQTMAIHAGLVLLPKMTSLFDYMTSRGGPVLHQLEQDFRNALDSPAMHEAESVIMQFIRNFGAVLKDATTATMNLWQAIQPVAAIFAGAFLLGLQGVGKVMANIVGPAVVAVTGFLKDNSDTIRILAMVVLPALLARLVVLKAMDVFSSLMSGLNTVLNYFQMLSKTIASGTMFDTLKLKAMYAADSVKNLGKEEKTLQEEMAGATGASGLSGFMGKLGAAVPLVGAAAIGVSLLGTAFSSSGDKAAEATASVDQFTTAMIRSKNNSSDAGMAFGHAAEDLDVLNKALSGKLAVNAKFEGTEVVDLKRSFDYLAESTVRNVSPMAQLGVELGKVNQVSGKATASLKSYDGGLANLVNNGQLDRAKQLMAEIASVTDNHGKALINTARDFPQYYAALDALASKQALETSSANGATSALNGNTSALNANSSATSGSTSSLDDMMQQLGGTASATDGLATATSDLMQQQQDMSKGLNADRSLDDYNRALKSLSTSLHDNGTAITGDSDAAMNNRDALRSAVQAIIDNYNAQVQLTGDTATATNKMQDQINKLENQKGMTQQTKDAIKAYVDQLNLIPPNVTTNVTANTSAASAKVDALSGKLAKLAGMDNSIDGGSSNSTPVVPKHRQYAMGGWVDGPKGAPQLAIVHGGEYVLSNDMLDGRTSVAAGVGGGFSGGGTIVNNYITVQGSVLAERDLRNLVETQMLQQGGRRSTTYTPYQR